MNLSRPDAFADQTAFVAGSSDETVQKEFYSRVGRVVRGRRTAIGMTQVALARMTGLARTSVINIEQGRQAVFLHQIVAMAQALRIDPWDLV